MLEGRKYLYVKLWFNKVFKIEGYVDMLLLCCRDIKDGDANSSKKTMLYPAQPRVPMPTNPFTGLPYTPRYVDMSWLFLITLFRIWILVDLMLDPCMQTFY